MHFYRVLERHVLARYAVAVTGTTAQRNVDSNSKREEHEADMMYHAFFPSQSSSAIMQR